MASAIVLAGDEYAQANFSPATSVDKNIKTFMNAIYGSYGFDAAAINFRVYQYLTLLHTLDELKEYVTLLDSRITYTPGQTNIFSKIITGPTVTKLNGDASLLVSTLPSTNRPQQMRLKWEIEVGASNTASIFFSIDGSLYTKTESFTVGDNGFSNYIVLPNSSLQASFENVLGARWRIEHYLYPSDSLKKVIDNALKKATKKVTDILFDPSKDEPIPSFSNLYYKHPDAKVRFGALLLALVWYLSSLKY